MTRARPFHWWLALLILVGVVALLRIAGDPARMAAAHRQDPAGAERAAAEAGQPLMAEAPRERSRGQRPRRLGWWWRNQVEPALAVLLHLARR